MERKTKENGEARTTHVTEDDSLPNGEHTIDVGDGIELVLHACAEHIVLLDVL